MAEPVVLKVSVRELVAFSLRRGDLFHHQFGTVTAMEGILGHQRVQRSRGEGYLPEVTVRHTHDYGPFSLEIAGRIDGVFEDQHPLVVEEIKTTRLLPEDIEPHAHDLHLAQGKLYAWMYGREHKLDQIVVQLTYLNMDSLKQSSTKHRFTLAELDDFFDEIVTVYMEWAVTMYQWRIQRDQSLAGLTFPFSDYRRGQRRFAAEVYRTIRDGKRLFAQAPTGIGKTAATLFPAFKALGEGIYDRLFFLTAKTSGVRAAAHGLAEIRRKGLQLKSTVISARDKVCRNAPCDLETCEYAVGYYDRIRAGLTDMFQSDHFDRTTIDEYAEKHKLCPFELSLDTAGFADLIVCDYNYAFDPAVHLRRFFGEQSGKNTLLIDEAHNLVDRSRDMYSAAIDKYTCLDLNRAIKAELPTVAKGVASVNRWLGKVSKKMDEAGERERTDTEVPKGLEPALHRFTKAYDEWRNDEKPAQIDKDLREFYFLVRGFLRALEKFDENFVIISRRERRNLEVKVQCLDASKLLEEMLARIQATVFFSATLTPFDYFARLLGKEKEGENLALLSPFPTENLCLLIASRISTRYVDRERTKGDIVAVIKTVVAARPGNYLVFFPSYVYLELVLSTMEDVLEDWQVLVQDRQMTDEERAAFLDQFEAESENTLVGFAVMGGVFGEGIDLVGTALIGVIVVGVGLPMVALERNLIRDHHNAQGEPGFAFAYQYPGMNKVLQTAGRLIRSESDRGVVCLIDDRFTEERYRQLYPHHWRPYFVENGQQLVDVLGGFWDEQGEQL